MPTLLVVRKELGRHRLVRIDALPDDFFAVVRPVLEVGSGGRRLILQVVNLSSAFVRPPKHCAFDQQVLRAPRAPGRRRASGLGAARSVVERLGLGDRPREAVEEEPAVASASRVRSSMRPMTTSSGTRRAGRHLRDQVGRELPRRLGRAEHVAGGDLRRCPNAAQTTFACVPLPAPGGPTNTSLMIQPLLVLPHANARGPRRRRPRDPRSCA